MTTEDHIKVMLDTLQLAIERERQMWTNPKDRDDLPTYLAVHTALGAVRDAILEVLGEPELELEPDPEPDDHH
jgi:hypothetical protein